MSTLQTRRRHDADTADQLVAIQDGRAIDKDQNGLGVSEEGVGYTLDGTGAQAVSAMNLRGRDEGARPELDDKASLRASNGGSSRSYVAGAMVRRLTPTECERLQGLPDGWTLLEESDEPNPKPDSPRYAACGDAVTANVSEWIGHRFNEVSS